MCWPSLLARARRWWGLAWRWARLPRSRRMLPTAVFDFIDGAAEDEVTLRRNREAFGRYALVPRVGIDVSAIDVAVTMLGQPLSVPLLLAPTGLCGMATSRGEIPAAR